jgi:apolipoprotein N-acyltransferase
VTRALEPAASPAPHHPPSSVRRGAAPPAVGRPLAGLAAGLVLSAAFAPLRWWWAAPLAVAAVTLATRGATLLQSAVTGWSCGLGFFLPLVSWLVPVAGVAAWIALCVVEALFLAGLAVGLTLAQRLAGWPVWTAALWVGEELLRDRVPFGGFPWGRLAFSQDATPLTPWAAVGGAPLVTFAVAVLGGLAAGAVVRPGRAAALAGSAGAGVALLAPVWVPSAHGGPAIRIALVQGDVPRPSLPDGAQQRAVLANHILATRDLAADVRAGRQPRPDLVVWPENASDIDPFYDDEAYRAIDDAVRDVGVPVLVGAVLYGTGGTTYRNVGMVWDPVTGPGRTYDKQRLVPFGEYVPLRGLLGHLSGRLTAIPQDFRPGSVPGALPVAGTVIADTICYEVADDAIVRGAVRGGGRVIVVQTNNASYGRTAQPAQQLAMTRLRAVEHGRAVVVAATSGISAVITPTGALIHRSAEFTRDVHVATVPERTDQTLATRVGAWPELALGLVGLAAAGGGAGLRRRPA